MLLKASVPTPRPSYLKSYSSVCLPGARASGLPAHALQVDQVPHEYGLAFEQVEAVAAEASARRQDHAFGAALRYLDFGGDRVRGIQQEWRVALRQPDHRPRVDELGASGRDIGPRRDDARGDRRVHREDLMLLRFRDEHLPHLLHLLRVLGRDVVDLAEILRQVVELEDLVVPADPGSPEPKASQGARFTFAAQHPAVLIQRPLAEHLEVLRLVP